MRVQPATPPDLPVVQAAYADARVIQRDQRAIIWPEFPDASILAEIRDGRVFLVMDGVTLAGVFTVTYQDPEIWGERERSEHIYLHRIARAAGYPGRGLFTTVLGWAQERCRSMGRIGLRIDTWASNTALIAYYERYGFRVVVARQPIGSEPRLLPHYQGIDLALLEAPVE